ncbi:MAG: helix-turn-helix domain-containing protein [Eubacteriales bacterium]|nr:helix-turn-helix domain-containing protein [Eubacteriales bacterium]
MLNTATRRGDLLPYPVIAAAVRGDPVAVDMVIRHYSGYIAALATRTSYDAHGNPYSQVDEDLRRRLETKLIISILSFDLN